MFLENKKYGLLIVGFILLLYGKTLSFSFVTDDWFNIFENAKIYSLKDFSEIFSKPQINFGEAVYYRPFDTISFLLSLKLFGSSATKYHLLNILLLIVFSYVLHNFLSKHFSDKRLIFLIVLWFLSHPLIVEPACWISAKNQIVEGIMFLAALISIDRIFFEKKYTFLLLLYSSVVTALLFHDIGIMLLPVVVVYSLIFYKSEIFEKKNLLILLIAVVIFGVFFILRNSVVPLPKSNYPTRTHLYTSLTILATYIKNILLPIELKIHYYNLLIKEGFDKEVIISSVVFLATVIPLAVYSIKDKKIRFGFLFFLITLFPASGVTIFIQKSLISDRYTFLPLIGISIIFCGLLSKRPEKKFVPIILCCVIAIFSFMNFNRQFVWQDDLANAKERVKEFPDNAVERSNLAAEFIKQNMLDEAEKELITALKLSKKPEESVYTNYAMLASIYGDLRLTEELYLEYLKYNEKSHRTLYNLGTFYLERGDRQKAKAYLERALQYVKDNDYEYADIMNNLGIVAYLDNDKVLSKKYFKEALRARPYDERYRKNADLE